MALGSEYTVAVRRSHARIDRQSARWVTDATGFERARAHVTVENWMTDFSAAVRERERVGRLLCETPVADRTIIPSSPWPAYRVNGWNDER